MEKIILISLIIIIFFGCLIWYTVEGTKIVRKDWKYLEYLKKKADVVETREEISNLHLEMLHFATKCKNEYIHKELRTIDGFLRGLYKNAK